MYSTRNAVLKSKPELGGVLAGSDGGGGGVLAAGAGCGVAAGYGVAAGVTGTYFERSSFGVALDFGSDGGAGDGLASLALLCLSRLEGVGGTRCAFSYIAAPIISKKRRKRTQATMATFLL
jgi:hypothetical protein